MKAEVGMKLTNLAKFLRDQLGCRVEILPTEDGYDLIIEKPGVVQDKIRITPENVNAAVMMFWDAWALARNLERRVWTERLKRLIEDEGEGEETYAEEEC
jgi:hypothetical protein